VFVLFAELKGVCADMQETIESRRRAGKR
jgi:hypothetical protein